MKVELKCSLLKFEDPGVSDFLLTHPSLLSTHTSTMRKKPRSQDPLSFFIKKEREGTMRLTLCTPAKAMLEGILPKSKWWDFLKIVYELTSNRKNQWQVDRKKTFAISPSLEILLRKASIVLCLSLVPKWGWERALKPSFYWVSFKRMGTATK